MYGSTHSLTSALEEVGGQRHASARFNPRERPNTHCTGDWVGLGVRSGRTRKISPPPVFELRTDQPIASQYL